MDLRHLEQTPAEHMEGHQDDTVTPPMTPHVFESKFELDSLNAVLKLSYAYYNATLDTTCFSAHNNQWLKAVETILDVMETMQVKINSLVLMCPPPSSRALLCRVCSQSVLFCSSLTPQHTRKNIYNIY